MNRDQGHYPDRYEGRYEERLARSMPTMSRRAMPAELNVKLRVIASRERQRQAAGRSIAARALVFYDSVRFYWNDLLRPLVIPLTGGVASAVVLFSMCVVPAYSLRANTIDDVPLTYLHDVTLAEVRGTSPFVTSADEVVVDVWVDGHGRMFDYAIVAGATVIASSELRRRLENMLLFTQFTPATEFGRPTASKLRLRLGSSQVEVRG
jgi:hypothetical protein